MPRLTKDQTRQKLRAAVVAEAVENGFGALSVGGVVKRAKVSAGTVYVHFETKDDMIQKVFLEIKTEFHQTMMAARSEPDTASMIRRMWFDMFAFGAARPAEFLFLEYASSQGLLTAEQQVETQRMSSEIEDMLRMGVSDGTLADLDVATLTLLLVAPALQLARSAAQGGTQLTQQTIERIFARVWRSVAADGVPVPLCIAVAS